MTKPPRKRKRTSSSRAPHPVHPDIHEEGGPDEAAAIIAETTERLAGLARRHHLEMLDYLLRMTHLEAQEWLRLRSKKKLS